MKLPRGGCGGWGGVGWGGLLHGAIVLQVQGAARCLFGTAESPAALQHSLLMSVNLLHPAELLRCIHFLPRTQGETFTSGSSLHRRVRLVHMLSRSSVTVKRDVISA